MEFNTFRLPNGIRVIHQYDGGIATVHCGFMIKAGSRDESRSEHGLAHLIEHCLFKGTSKRKAFQILNRIDSVGGEINAYTTKEETCIFSSALKEHFQRASELLFDIVFDPRFPSAEIEKEKQVILDEINSYKDAPDEMLFDDFEEMMYPDQSIGRSILGAESIIQELKRDDLVSFIDRHYSTDQIVFSVVGNVSARSLDHFCNRYLATVPERKFMNGKRHTPEVHVFHQHLKKQVHQCHAIIGSQAPSTDDDQRRPMVLLNNILGGPAMNSRLNLNIREKFGFCYHIESGYNPYSDTGIFQVYFGTDERHYKKTLKLVKKELKRFVDEPLKPRSLAVFQNQLLGQAALARENRSSLMLSLGKSLLHFGKVDTFQEFAEDLRSITADDLRETAADVFANEKLSNLAFFPQADVVT